MSSNYFKFLDEDGFNYVLDHYWDNSTNQNKLRLVESKESIPPIDISVILSYISEAYQRKNKLEYLIPTFDTMRVVRYDKDTPTKFLDRRNFEQMSEFDNIIEKDNLNILFHYHYQMIITGSERKVLSRPNMLIEMCKSKHNSELTELLQELNITTRVNSGFNTRIDGINYYSSYVFLKTEEDVMAIKMASNNIIQSLNFLDYSNLLPDFCFK